ncbi:MAG: GAF domain-containing protein [Xenococcus sp. MO_188.B8]|nr:GAF domain-containing protein [Xenococcus sp. MO_188.B8]
MSKDQKAVMSEANMNKSTESKISVEEILALRKNLGNKLLKCKTIKGILEISFKEIERKIHPQVSSVFLFLKDGYIERIGTYGIDKDGKHIEDDWLPNEKYKPGESFSGRAAKPLKPSLIYGESFFCKNIKQEFFSAVTKENSKLFLKYGKKYEEKLGFLHSGISVPLNGSHRTFGTIEVLNKQNSNGEPDPTIALTKEDLCWLTVVGAHVSSAFSRLRKAKEDEIISFLSSQLVKSTDEQNDNKKTTVYQSVADHLVNHQLMPYKACIIRVLEEDKLLVVANECSPDIVPKNNAARAINEGIVGEVYIRKRYKAINISKKTLKNFYSWEWINKNKLKSFFCFPCLIQGKVVGTISLFTGYEHSLDEDDINFLQNVSFLVAAYRVGVKKYSEIGKEDVLIPFTISSNVNKSHIEKLLHKDYKHIVENYQKLIESTKNQYINAIKAKDREIEMYKDDIKRLNKTMNELISKPIIIQAIQENAEKKN